MITKSCTLLFYILILFIRSMKSGHFKRFCLFFEVWSLQTILLILLSSAPHGSRFASRLAPDRLLLKIHLSG